ncbi:hypothetical protein [Halocalculus aciditolerans]|uniref:Uncharacterized protein n=1 Tax=Halocalculus aciditolerans TaxID=1383812 RepID=A0A830F635_9EURY|nr:hypothetical protein [Halocalculus aciditolerans]GGL58153.1 hypothetical protein GCM10009039_15420 [Halocalculus aciditolerans]
MHEGARNLIDHLHDADIGQLRRAIAYDGEEYDVVFEQTDLSDALSPEEEEELAKNLILKGFDDDIEQPEFGRFGHLDMSVRWFHDVVVLQVPLGEWSGVILSYNRDSIVDTGAFTDTALDYIDNPESELREQAITEDAEDADERVEDQFS